MDENVLIIAAHPDDEVLGCGGTIAKHVAEGDEVRIMIMAEGVTSRDHSHDVKARRDQVSALARKAREVGAFLGAKSVELLSFPDNRMDTLPLLVVVKELETRLEKIKPSIVYTHHHGDLNIDHQITHRAVITACRPVSDRSVMEIYAFEVPSSTDWAFQQFQPAFRANVFYNITTTLETKIKAMEMYESESRPYPHPRSPEALRALARRWGSVVGLEGVEAFELIRYVRK